MRDKMVDLLIRACYAADKRLTGEGIAELLDRAAELDRTDHPDFNLGQLACHYTTTAKFLADASVIIEPVLVRPYTYGRKPGLRQGNQATLQPVRSRLRTGLAAVVLS